MTELELRDWLARAPPGTLVRADQIAQAMPSDPATTHQGGATQQPASWRERLWHVPPDTRLGVAELLEALGRTRSWLYRHTGPNGPGARIPHRKLEGELVFVAGEVRQWVCDTEMIVVTGRPEAKAPPLTLRRHEQRTGADA